MDPYEKMLKDLDSLPIADREEAVAGLKGQCICPGCPTYTDCSDQVRESLYCFLGRSPECISEELGCICPDCPVAVLAGLSNLYYCINGSEKEERGK